MPTANAEAPVQQPEKVAKKPVVDAKAVIAKYNLLVQRRATREADWDEAIRYMMPRRIDATGATSVAEATKDVYDDTAIIANNTLAAGLVSTITPATERWAALESPAAFRDENQDENAQAVRGAWYQDATDTLSRAIANSNFHTEIHELHLCRNIICTGAMGVFEGDDSPLVFKHVPPKTFTFTEDNEGRITSFFREMANMTLEQVVRQWGEDSLPEKYREKLKSDNPADKQATVRVLHAVEKRMPGSYNPQKIDGANKPYSSAYILIDDKHVLDSGGYDDMPYVVGRFLKWGADQWGYGPGIEALPSVRQLNFIEQHADVAAEIAVFPRVMAPQGMKGKLDLAAAGITFFDPNQPNARPTVWGTEMRPEYLDVRADKKREAVRRLFHNDLFQMLGGIEPGKMTAYETMQRFSEKLDMFSPSFKMVTTEILAPIVKRCFTILFKMGYFAPPPPEVFVQTSRGFVMPMPQVSFVSKMALAIRALENRSWVEFMNVITPMLQVDPTIADNFDLDRATLGIARNLAVSTGWVRKPEDRDAMRAERAQAQQQAQAMQQAQQLADAAGKLGRAPTALQDVAGSALAGMAK